MKKNCWEFMKCGREPNGDKVSEIGVCPAAAFTLADGFCGGKNGGRSCCYITGTFCAGIIQGTHSDKKKKCEDCDFYALLGEEEGRKRSSLQFNEFIKERIKNRGGSEL